MGVTKLSAIIRYAGWITQKQVRRAEVYTEQNGTTTVILRFRDGSSKEMHAPGPVTVDWAPDSEVQTQQKRVWDEHS